MIKKILLFALVMFPVISFAQETKIAYADYADLVVSMPEYQQLRDTLLKREQAFQDDMKVISEDFNRKLSEYIAQQETLIESIKLRREQELNDIREKAAAYQQDAEREQAALEQALFIPIQAKLQKAIEEVGSENNFLYVFNAQPNAMILLYVSPNAIDAAPLIKKKLGIQ